MYLYIYIYIYIYIYVSLRCTNEPVHVLGVVSKTVFGDVLQMCCISTRSQISISGLCLIEVKETL